MGSISRHTDGEQLLPVILDNRAKSDPDGVWAKFPISPTSYAQGFRSVTHFEVARAVDKVAWILEETLGRSKTFETIAYLGPNDLRCTIVVLAGVKVGYKVNFISSLGEPFMLTKIDILAFSKEQQSSACCTPKPPRL